MNDEIVIASLYVDERTKLPKSERKVVKVNGKNRKMETIGDKWSFMQQNDYKISSQPFYIMQDTEGNDLGNGSADFQNHGSPKLFEPWLKKGLEEFKKK